MEIIAMIIVGFFVGLLARFIKPGNDSMGFIMTTALGIVGAVVGGFLGRFFGLYAPNEPAGFIASIIGAVIVLAVVKMLWSPRAKAI